MSPAGSSVSTTGSSTRPGYVRRSGFSRYLRQKAGKNRLHLDLYATGSDNALPMERRIEIVEAKVAN